MLLRGHRRGNGQQVKLSRVGLANASGAYVEFTEGSGTRVESLQRSRQCWENEVVVTSKGRDISKIGEGFPPVKSRPHERHRYAYQYRHVYFVRMKAISPGPSSNKKISLFESNRMFW